MRISTGLGGRPPDADAAVGEGHREVVRLAEERERRRSSRRPAPRGWRAGERVSRSHSCTELSWQTRGEVAAVGQEAQRRSPAAAGAASWPTCSRVARSKSRTVRSWLATATCRPSGERTSRLTSASGPRIVARSRERCGSVSRRTLDAWPVRIHSPPPVQARAVTPDGWRTSSRRASPAERRPHVPQAQVGVERAGGEGGAVGREGERPHRLVVAQPHRHLLALRHVPQVHDAVHVGGGEERAVGREGEAQGRRVVAGAQVQVGAQDVGAVARAQVPEADGAVRAGHGQDVGHRGERRLLGGGRLAEGARARGRRPRRGRAAWRCRAAPAGPAGTAPWPPRPAAARARSADGARRAVRGAAAAPGGGAATVVGRAQALLDDLDERHDAGARGVERLRAPRGLERAREVVLGQQAPRLGEVRLVGALARPRGRAASPAAGSRRSRARSAFAISPRSGKRRVRVLVEGPQRHGGEGLRAAAAPRVERGRAARSRSGGSGSRWWAPRTGRRPASIS